MSGNNLYQVLYPATSITSEANSLTSDTTPSPVKLVELPSRFRSTIWLKRGSFVVVDTAALADRSNKLGGEIVNVVRDEKEWRKMAYWPKEDKEFDKKVGVSVVAGSGSDEDSSDNEDARGNGMVGRMPSSESEGEEEAV